MNITDSSKAFTARIDAWNAQLATMTLFASQYGPFLPSGIAAISLDTYGEKPTCSISTGYSNENRVRSLALCAEVFGNSGWTKGLNHDRTAYNWTRNIDGIEVMIYKAEIVPQETDKMPVPPSAFPVLLKEDAA